MLKYHVKITDNETGEVIDDSDILCMFGGIGAADGVRQCALSHGALNFHTAATLASALEVVEMVIENSGGDKMRELIQAMIEGRGDGNE